MALRDRFGEQEEELDELVLRSQSFTAERDLILSCFSAEEKDVRKYLRVFQPYRDIYLENEGKAVSDVAEYRTVREHKL